MNETYSKDQFSTRLQNQEIEEYLLDKLRDDPRYEIKIDFCEDKNYFLDRGDIQYIILDGDKEEFMVVFYGDEIAIFLLDEKFMFIDDKSRKNTVSSDTTNNVVYEGSLRDKTHKEICELLYLVIDILAKAKEIKLEENVVEIREGIQYPKCDYIVKLKNPEAAGCILQIENITFVINERGQGDTAL